MQKEANYVGIDISKKCFDVAVMAQGRYTYQKLSNDQDGFKVLLQSLPPSAHVVMEASGPYYLRLATCLHEHGIGVSVVNPLVIRRFCQMRLSRTKTDKKDAAMIAEYGKTEQPGLWQPQPDYVLELGQLQALSDQLVGQRTAANNLLEAFSQGTVVSKMACRTCRATIKNITRQLKLLEAKMEQLAAIHYGDAYKQLQTIPGVGKKTAMVLLVATGGFKRFTNAKQLSAYFGLSPRIFESGSSVKGKARITKMGMGRIRATLYMCTWSAKNRNAACKELYDRLVAKGKAKRLALIAVANKLLKQAFAIVTNNTTYQPNYSKNICL